MSIVPMQSRNRNTRLLTSFVTDAQEPQSQFDLQQPLQNNLKSPMYVNQNPYLQRDYKAFQNSMYNTNGLLDQSTAQSIVDHPQVAQQQNQAFIQDQHPGMNHSSQYWNEYGSLPQQLESTKAVPVSLSKEAEQVDTKKQSFIHDIQDVIADVHQHKKPFTTICTEGNRPRSIGILLLLILLVIFIVTLVIYQNRRRQNQMLVGGGQKHPMIEYFR